MTGLLPSTDKVGRKWPIVAGLLLCGLGVWATPVVNSPEAWMTTAAVIGLGMALFYPTLLAVIGDVSDPCWRGTSLGVYRMWRDSGYAFGALLIGVVSDTFGFAYGFYITSAAILISGSIVAVTMYETAPRQRRRTSTLAA